MSKKFNIEEIKAILDLLESMEFDMDGDGLLTKSELRRLVDAFEESTEIKEEIKNHLDEFIEFFDNDGDGMMSVLEFLGFIETIVIGENE